MGSGSYQKRGRKSLVEHLCSSPEKSVQIGAKVRTAPGRSFLMEECRRGRGKKTQMNDMKEICNSFGALCGNYVSEKAKQFH